MEVEFGLKITKIIDDFASTELLIAKDQAGPLFLSRETDSMFILTAHLKGYRRKNIKIEINKDGTIITISGEKHVQEMVMVGWKMIKKEIEKRGFRKAFKIPNGVDLDKIKAKFNEEESILTISMPKLVKGVIIGGGIEEVKEDEVAGGGSETVQIVANEVTDKETLQQQEYKEADSRDIKESDQEVENFPEAPEIGSGKGFEELAPEKAEETGLKENADQVMQQTELPSVERAQVVEENTCDGIPRVERKMQGEELEKEETSQGIEEVRESKDGQELDQTKTSLLEQPIDRDQHDKDQEVHGKEEIQGTKNENQEEGNALVKLPPPKKSKLCCVPIVAGSAFLVSLIVIVFHFIRTQNKHSNIRAKKD